MKEIKAAFIKSIFTQTTMGVIITSLIAPYIITKINTGIENKKIQTELVTKILDMTRETDFNDDRQLKRYAIYAQIVKDNPKLFNVKLDATLDKANSLFSDYSKKKHQLETVINELDILKIQKMEYGKNNLRYQEKLQSNDLTQNEIQEIEDKIEENSGLLKKTHNEIEYKENEKTRLEIEFMNIRRGI